MTQRIFDAAKPVNAGFAVISTSLSPPTLDVISAHSAVVL
jgi:hypothetical protein